MKSFESLVMRLSKATLAGNIHHQHCLAGVLGEENLRIRAFKMEQSTMILITWCPRWSSAERSKKSSAASDNIAVLSNTAKIVFRDILTILR